MRVKRRNLLKAGMGMLGLSAVPKGLKAQQAPPGATARRRFLFGTHFEPPVNSNVQPSTVDWNYKARRINKAIELWEDGQPIYYGGWGVGPGVDAYAQGVRMAHTYMDAINVSVEHGAQDVVQLREFMRGLVDGGPTRSGHRTPAVFVEPAVIGLDKDYMRANTWVLEQLLDAGVHGLHICHARDPEAIRVATQLAMRYPFPRNGIPQLTYQGLRGSSAFYAAQIWGVNGNKYCHLADLWPLNKQGELICGVKIEDTYCDQTYQTTIGLPGIAMAEWGPGDHSYWYYGLSIMPEDGRRLPGVDMRPQMVKLRQAVLDACKAHKVMFLNAGGTNPNDPASYVIKQIQDGAMVLEAGEQAAIMGREYTKRRMPV